MVWSTRINVVIAQNPFFPWNKAYGPAVKQGGDASLVYALDYLSLTLPVSQNFSENIGTFFGMLRTHLTVMLIPQICDPYKLYLLAKVTNQAYQQYRVKNTNLYY